MKNIAFAGVLGFVALVAVAQSPNGTVKSTKQEVVADGARLFAVNCGRCHRPPDQLSPKITGSVLRHMRVRAMLSKQDEQAILKYLAP